MSGSHSAWGSMIGQADKEARERRGEQPGWAFRDVEAETDQAWAEWLEATYDPDNERLEDREV